MKSKALYAQSSWQSQITEKHASWKGLKEVHWSSPSQSRSSWARMLRVICRWDWLSPRMEIPLLSPQPPTVLDCPQFFLLFFLRTVSNFRHSNLSSGLWPFHCVTRSHRSFPTGLFSTCFPAHSLEQLFHPNCWAAHLPLSKFMTFLSARFSIISRSFQKAACLATRAALGLQIVSVVSVFTQLIHTDAKLFSPLCFNHSISLSEITILFYFPVEQKS